MAAYWQAVLPLARATTSVAAQSHPFDRGRRHGTSSFQYLCRSRQSRSWSSEASKCSSILTPPGQLQSLAGQEHGRTIPLADFEPPPPLACSSIPSIFLVTVGPAARHSSLEK